MNDWEFQESLNKFANFKLLGFDFEYNQDGYKVFYKDKFIGGASVKLPREKSLHWKVALKNRRDNLKYAVITAEEYARKNNIK